ncbi:MAG TPA: folylpolyglutamate synthase/dihydrofolate synthase family protein [Actinomycetota bacterium]|nr:folylpolyglutamate synthase/dihydrofolate synthase family protein [Actinomycetota bacterium]
MALSFKEASALIEGRGFGIKPDLSRIRRLLELTDNPHLGYPTLHLAGTNGKSSTARMAGAILAAHGLNSGVYTSPHLQTIRERMALAGWGLSGLIWECIPEREFASTLEYLLPFIDLVERDLGQMTYFEVSTALAFEWMLERSVAAGVVETGLGGRWDATNLIQSVVAVLTHIDVDHSKMLGSTPLENAHEKVEIIKPGAWVISDRQEPEVGALVAQQARKKGATLRVLGSDFRVLSNVTAVGGRVISVDSGLARYEELFVPLHGIYQASNLAMAIAACESFMGRSLDAGILAAVVADMRSPGRLEVLGHQPLVLLDGAHNPHAAAALARSITEEFHHRNLTVVFTVSKDKDIEGILSNLSPLTDRFIVSRFNNKRAASPVEVAALPVLRGKQTKVVESLEEAVDLAISAAAEDDIVLVTGSLYGVGEAREHLTGKGRSRG